MRFRQKKLNAHPLARSRRRNTRSRSAPTPRHLQSQPGHPFPDIVALRLPLVPKQLAVSCANARMPVKKKLARFPLLDRACNSRLPPLPPSNTSLLQVRTRTQRATIDDGATSRPSSTEEEPCPERRHASWRLLAGLRGSWIDQVCFHECLSPHNLPLARSTL
jgi:hypothetical protein